MAGQPKKRARKGKKPPAGGPARGPGRGGPAKGKGKGPKMPQVQKGNKLHRKHGANEAELVEPRAKELSPGVFEANLQLDPTRDGAAVFRYCVTLARIERVYHWLGEQDDEVFTDQEAGDVHAVYRRLEQWEASAERAENTLAIAPLTRARLGLDLQKAEANAKEVEAKATKEARERLDVRVAEIGKGK